MNGSAHVPSAALAAAPATRGSTTDARKATVDMIGLPLLLNGMGWYASGPEVEIVSYRDAFGESVRSDAHNTTDILTLDYEQFVDQQLNKAGM